MVVEVVPGGEDGTERRRGASTDMHDGEDGLRQGHCGVRVKASPFTKKESI